MLAEMFKICRPIFRGKPGAAPAPNSRVTFAEVTQLRERRYSKGLRSAAIEKNNLEIFEPIFSDAECSDYHSVCPYVREKFVAAFEYAARVGERERMQFLGLSAAKFLKFVAGKFLFVSMYFGYRTYRTSREIRVLKNESTEMEQKLRYLSN
jgi:hypothetical protein